MAVNSSREAQTGTLPVDQALHVSAYVDLSIEAVIERFAPPHVDELLTTAVTTVLGGGGHVQVDARAAAPVWVSSSHVRVPVMWRITAPARTPAEGSATISLLVVQSGDDAITELLATVPAPSAGDERSTDVLHEVLAELSRRLEAS